MIKSSSLNIRKNGELIYITFPNLDDFGVINCFTTKLGGVSNGHFSTMNMSFSRGDDKQNVLENYKIICNELGVDYTKCVLSKQTHTTNIRIVTEKDIGKGIICDRDYDDVDGLITNVPGITLVTQFADCVGLLFYDKAKKVIATSHAGWRGTVGMIGKKTAELMCNTYGSDPADIYVGIAPSIGPCCFEVDSPVFEEFKSIEMFKNSDIITDDKNGKYHIDLWKANYLPLIDFGIKAENICVTDLCTKCNNDIFFSHRFTNGKRGNLAAMISLPK